MITPQEQEHLSQLYDRYDLEAPEAGDTYETVMFKVSKIIVCLLERVDALEDYVDSLKIELREMDDRT